MTKSSAPKVAAKRARGTYRKTAAKAVAEKARGDSSSQLVRAPWQSTVRLSTLLGAISIPVSVSQKAWPATKLC